MMWLTALTATLVVAAGQDTQDSPASLLECVTARTLEPAEASTLVERALAIQADAGQAWDPTWGRIVEAAHENGLATDAQLERYVRTALERSEIVRVRARVHEDAQLPVRVDYRDLRAAGKGMGRLTIRPGLETLWLGGPLRSLAGFGSSTGLGRLETGGHVFLTIEGRHRLPVGPCEVRVGITLSVLRDDEVLFTIPRDIGGELEVVPADVPVIELAVDEAIADALVDAVWVSDVDARTSRDGRTSLGCDVTVVRPPIAVAWYAYATAEGGRWPIGEIRVEAGEEATVELGWWAEGVPDDLRRLDLMLEPAPTLMAEVVGADRIWGERLWMEDLRVQWPPPRRAGRAFPPPGAEVDGRGIETLLALPDDELAAVIERGLSIQADPERPWHPEWGDLIEAAWAAGRIGEATIARYVRQAIEPVLEMRLRRRTRAGEPIELRGHCRYARSARKSRFQIRLWPATCRIAGVDRRAVADVRGVAGTNRQSATSKMSFGGHVDGAGMAEGTYDARLVFHVGVVERPEARLDVATPPGQWVEPVARWTQEFRSTIDLVGEDDRLCELVGDPASNRKLQERLHQVVCRVEDHDGELHGVTSVHVDLPPADMSVDVIWRADGRELVIGADAALAGPTAGLSVRGPLEAWFDPDTRRIELVLRSHPAPRRGVGFDGTLWSGELVVPVRLSGPPRPVGREQGDRASP